MRDLSRRDLLRASAGAAAVAAVPMSAIAAPAAQAATDEDVDLDAAAPAGPVMFCVQDAARGEVAILHGMSEVVVTDRRLVAQIMNAAALRPAR